MAGVNWDYYDKFEALNDKYLPDRGEGDNMATQACTAVNKLVYKWYNDGDVYDNTAYLTGWCNDLSSYANWLANNIAGTRDILTDIFRITSEDDYEQLLKTLTDFVFTDAKMEDLSANVLSGSVYTCNGPFKFEEPEEEDDYWEEEEEEEWY